MTYERVPGVDGLWITSRSWNGESADLKYLYGGGYVISSPHSRRKLAGHLSNASGALPPYHLQVVQGEDCASNVVDRDALYRTAAPGPIGPGL